SQISLAVTTSRPGGGTMPRSEFPSIALKITPSNQSIPKLARKLRIGTPAVVGYTTDDALFLDLRTIFPDTDQLVSEALKNALS
ncbi:MAG: L-seryl-tRNA(Sec) selenium transferase, partial [Akkermansiaceae bacterium]